MLKSNKTGYYTFLVVFFLSLLSLGGLIERYQTASLLFAYSSAFFSYIFILIKQEDSNLLLISGILIRISFFFSLPALSDDLYRFIWDGTLLKNGIHPFSELPSYYLNQDIDGISQDLFDRLNSPNYFTIYPPLNQFIFWLSAMIGNGDWLLSANVIRFILMGADIGSYFLLKKLLKIYDKPESLAFWYFLNPLVILEFVGNLHFECLVIFFVLLGIYGFEKNRKVLSATGLGLAIGTKLLPLIYLPYFFVRGIKYKKWSISILAGFIGLLTLVPMLNPDFIRGMQESLDLYFRSFEFNASIYFIARQIGYWIYGHNNIATIGPFLSLLSVLSILTISIIGTIRSWSIPKTLLFILSAYLAFATTVHPWYIIPLISFGILSGYWYPVIWSLLIFLTYVGYNEKGFELPMFIIFIEYSITGLVLLTEIRKKRL